MLLRDQAHLICYAPSPRVNTDINGNMLPPLSPFLSVYAHTQCPAIATCLRRVCVRHLADPFDPVRRLHLTRIKQGQHVCVCGVSWKFLKGTEETEAEDEDEDVGEGEAKVKLSL